MTKETIEQIITITLADLESVNNYTAKDALKDAAKKALGRGTTNRDPLFWPAGLLMLGLSEACLSYSGKASDIISEQTKVHAISSLESYFDRWIKAGENVSYIDDSIAGLSLISLYESTGERRYHHGAAKIASFLSQAKKDSDESLIYNPSKGNDLIYADGAGQSAMFLSRYGTVFHKQAAIALAARQLLNFHKSGFDQSSGLPYHAFSLSQGKKLGIIGWGRAVGWLMMGYSELLANLEISSAQSGNSMNDTMLRSTAEKLMGQYYNLVKTVLTYQRPDGGFSWLLPAIEGEADTSATAMIAYSLKVWLRSGAFRAHSHDLGEDVKKAVLDAKDFLLEYTEHGSVNQSLSSCEDIAVHRQVYGHYPWGQGSTLAFLSITD